MKEIKIFYNDDKGRHIKSIPVENIKKATKTIYPIASSEVCEDGGCIGIIADAILMANGINPYITERISYLKVYEVVADSIYSLFLKEEN